MYIKLETERLLIRPISMSDKDFIFSLMNTNGWLEFIGDRNIRSIMDAENYIQKILEKENCFYSVFELKDTKRAIGIVTFLKRDSQEYPDFGFATLTDFEGNGFSYEASKAYLESVDHENFYKIVLGITKSSNLKSRGLLIKLGFVFKEKQFDEKEQVIEIYERISIP